MFVGELDRVRMTVPPHFLYRDYYRWFEDLRTLRFEGRGVTIPTTMATEPVTSAGKHFLTVFVSSISHRDPLSRVTQKQVMSLRSGLWRSIPLTNLSTKSIWDTCANCTRLSLMV